MWRKNCDACALKSSPLIIDNHVLQATFNGNLICSDISTGCKIWSRSISPKKAIFSDLLFLEASQNVVVCSIDGNLYLFNYPKANILRSFNLNSPMFASPSFSCSKANQIIVGTHGSELYCVDVEKMSICPLYRSEAPIAVKPLIFIKSCNCSSVSDMILFVESNGHLVLLDFESRQVVCDYFLPNNSFSSPRMSNDHIFIGLSLIHI